MSESRPDSGPGVMSRFRAVVIAALRVKQLRRGSKPRIELEGKKHKDTCIAMEEVRRGLITLASVGESQAHEPEVLVDAPVGVEESLPLVGSTGGY